MTDHEEFEAHVVKVLNPARKFLIKWFGQRCEEYDPNCECCRRWRLLDNLLENPFDE